MVHGLSRANADWKTEVAERQARQDLRHMPSRHANRALPVNLTIVGGQSMGTANSITTYGIEKYAGTLTVTAGTYDPGEVDPDDGVETAAPSPALDGWPSGLGPATMWDGVEYSRVIVCNDSRGGCFNALLGCDTSDATNALTGRQVTVRSNQEIAVAMSDGSHLAAWSPGVG